MTKDGLVSKLCAVTVLSVVLPLTSFAVGAGRFSTIIPSRQTPVIPAIDGGLPDEAPEIQNPQPPSQPVDEAAKAIMFNFNKIIFEGMTVFQPDDLLPLYKDMLGKKISLADLQMLTEKFEKYYAERGYILTRVIIPPQEIGEDGVVRIQIIEGYVADVVIQGDTKKVLGTINSYTEPVLGSRPLQISVLERAVLLINDLPGVTTKAVLTPSPDVPGASTLVLVVSQYVFDGALAWDNRGTKYVGPQEFTLNSTLNNLFQHVSQVGADIKVTASTHELQSYQASYMLPVFGNGSTLEASGTYNHVLPGNDLSNLEIDGLSESATLLYTYPVIRSRRTNLNITFDYDYLYSKTDILSALFSRDRIESLRFGFSYDGVDSLQGINLVSGMISQGIELGTGDDEPPILRTRLNGTKDYTKITASVSRMQYLPAQFSLYLSTAGQYAFNPLLSAEQIGYGGVEYGSAYDSSEIISDSGVEGKAELRYNSSQTNALFRSVQYYASYDFGVLWARDNDALAPKQSGTSAAAGIRLNMGPRVFSTFEIAKPLTLKVAAYDNRDFRGFFSITVDLGSQQQ